ncbi:MAG TPA: hypothetical protein VEL03_04885 [Streptosporangiaceae bacterium]|nr:hypothetical protein [Streptosporangiaceae bacterium]
MYGRIWRSLPGGTGARLTQLVVLAVAVALVLWFVVYPWASVHLPLGQSGIS